MRLRSHARNYAWDKASTVPAILSDYNDDYLYGLGLVRRFGPAGDQYYHEDGLGSIGILTDPWGQSMSPKTYDAFGALRSGAAAYDFMFAGEQLDAETGLYYLRARYYDPTIGRFLTRDPFPGSLLDPAGLHPYLYAGDNPVNLTDPTGECGLGCLIPYFQKGVEVLQKGAQFVGRAGPAIQRGAAQVGPGARSFAWNAENFIKGCVGLPTGPNVQAALNAVSAGRNQISVGSRAEAEALADLLVEVGTSPNVVTLASRATGMQTGWRNEVTGAMRRFAEYDSVTGWHINVQQLVADPRRASGWGEAVWNLHVQFPGGPPPP